MLFAFGERLRQLRHDKNYTMGMVEDRLAQKNVSIGQSALGKYEAGRTYPNLETAAALADIFDVSLDYLAMGSKSKTLTLQDLSEEQIKLLTELAALLRQHNHSSVSPSPTPTSEEQDVLFRLISQFMKSEPDRMRRFASDFAFSDAFLQLGTISGELVHGAVSYSHRKGSANPGTDHDL